MGCFLLISFKTMTTRIEDDFVAGTLDLPQLRDGGDQRSAANNMCRPTGGPNHVHRVSLITDL
jgi:hypothetical protein